MKIEIDEDAADGIVVCSLKQQIKYLQEDTNRLNRKKSLSKWEKDCLQENIVSLDYLQKTFEYYGGTNE